MISFSLGLWEQGHTGPAVEPRPIGLERRRAWVLLPRRSWGISALQLNRVRRCAGLPWRSSREDAALSLPGAELCPWSGDKDPTSCVSSVAQSGPTLCDPRDRSTPGLPVHHQHAEFTQTPVRRVGDAIQPSQAMWCTKKKRESR